MFATRRPFNPPPVPSEFRLAVRALNLLGGFDWQGIPWVAQYLGIEDIDRLVLDLITLRDS